MKKLFCIILILSALFICATAHAEPTPSPSASPEASDGSSPELISYGVKGEAVVRIQLRLRELGYFSYKPTGSFQNLTVEATKRFQQKQTDSSGQPIMSDGTVGAQSMAIIFSHRAQRADIAAKIPIGKQLSGQASVTGELVDWSEVKGLLSEGTPYSVTDYNTGVTFRMVCTVGEGHAEAECASSEDTAVYKEAFGGEYNYSKRPVVIAIGSRNIAASLQGQPHGESSVRSNDMPGHACLFFSGSSSHVVSLPDVEHQAQVYKAAGRG